MASRGPGYQYQAPSRVMPTGMGRYFSGSMWERTAWADSSDTPYSVEHPPNGTKISMGFIEKTS